MQWKSKHPVYIRNTIYEYVHKAPNEDMSMESEKSSCCDTIRNQSQLQLTDRQMDRHIFHSTMASCTEVNENNIYSSDDSTAASKLSHNTSTISSKSSSSHISGSLTSQALLSILAVKGNGSSAGASSQLTKFLALLLCPKW